MQRIGERNSFDYSEKRYAHDDFSDNQSSIPVLRICENCEGKKVVVITTRQENQQMEEKSVKCPICKGEGVVI